MNHHIVDSTEMIGLWRSCAPRINYNAMGCGDMVQDYGADGADDYCHRPLIDVLTDSQNAQQGRWGAFWGS